MYIHTLARFCESRRCFSLLLSLKYISYLFSSAPSLLPYLLFVPLLHRSPRRKAIRVPLSSLPSACPPLLLSVVCAVAAVCVLLCPLPSPRPRGLFRVSVCCVCAPLKLFGGLLYVLPCVSWLLPSLVSHQAQNAVTVWADAPRICPRPFALLPVMCCRVFRCPFRGLSCLLSSVRVCVVLPCVVWW